MEKTKIRSSFVKPLRPSTVSFLVLVLDNVRVRYCRVWGEGFVRKTGRTPGSITPRLRRERGKGTQEEPRVDGRDDTTTQIK